jgi:hypothetical protein
MKKDDVCFKQSLSDFPMVVSLDKKAPMFELSRWGNSGLRFIPLDGEGFILRGDRRRLVYKGRRRSHRFTILADSAFEYDCILLREPESNVITLFMEGAEHYDFFRQPDFVTDPFLKGSYAVYKKETLLGEGTGKLCHIHRPLMIDARGRRVWGDLSVVGNCLCITIPENWLSEASYPVVVDPTIGTTTIGSQTTGTDPNNKWYDRPWLDNEFALNKYQIPQNGNGLCTAYVYTYNQDVSWNVIPLLYTNDNNKPFMKKSQNEKTIDVEIWTGKPAGWRNNTFNINGNINAGDYIWFGLFGSYFTTRFDYGGECYKGWFDYEQYEEYDGEPTPFINITPYVSYCTIKWSWYFNYTAVTSQNYTRTLTQGATLTDSRKLTGEYKRGTAQSVKAQAIPTGLLTLCRNIKEAVQGIDSASFPVNFIRSMQDTSTITDYFGLLKTVIRGLVDVAGTNDEVKGGWVLFRYIADTVNVASMVFRGLLLFVKILTTSLVRDYILRRFLIAREEIVLKSCITREITLESKIN